MPCFPRLIILQVPESPMTFEVADQIKAFYARVRLCHVAATGHYPTDLDASLGYRPSI